MLVIKDLTKKFGDKIILDALSLRVNKGEIAIFLGQSGVGKSTLLRVLNNLETMDGGTLLLDDKQITPAELNQQHIVGMVFQNFNLFDHLSVLENITLPLTQVVKKSPQEANAIALDLLDRYGLKDKAQNYPAQLSGGQKQRLAIARTLALKPKIICLDEPTSALDPLLTTFVARNIQQLADEGYIVLVATHDTVLLEKLKCSIYLMKNGEIMETAQSEDFLSDPKAYPKISAFVAGTHE